MYKKKKDLIMLEHYDLIDNKKISKFFSNFTVLNLIVVIILLDSID